MWLYCLERELENKAKIHVNMPAARTPCTVIAPCVVSNRRVHWEYNSWKLRRLKAPQDMVQIPHPLSERLEVKIYDA